LEGDDSLKRVPSPATAAEVTEGNKGEFEQKAAKETKMIKKSGWRVMIR
jgi:hypothetical protein